MSKKAHVLFIGVLVISLQASTVTAQDVSPGKEGELIRSMGIPSRYEFSLSPMFVVDRDGDGTNYGGQLSGGAYRHLLSPLLGLGLTGEGYVEKVDGEKVDGGVRLLGGVKILFLNMGVDHKFGDESTDLILSLSFPPIRGGLFGRGINFRADWLPGRDHSFNIGFSIPLGQPYKGKTRPKQDQVTLPESPTGEAGQILPSELEQAMGHLRHAAEWINRYTTPFFDQNEIDNEEEMAGFVQKVRFFKAHLNLKDGLYPEGHTFEAEIRMYNRMIEKAFALSVTDGEMPSAEDVDEGRRIAGSAREILFQEVIVPYNRLLGRSKKNDSLLGYGAMASARFGNWLDLNTQLSSSQRATALSVFDRLLLMVEERRHGSRSTWKDSELVWIPLQYGLHPNQYDTREKVNGLLEQITEAPFSHANQVFYVINEQFQPEVARMIREAEDYHVLWIHDYRGVNAAGQPDSVSFSQTLDVYLAALSEKVKAYDATGRLPVYIILIDQYFFESNGRFWVELLQDPLNYKLRLSADYRPWVEQIEAAQEELRTAVAESRGLQEQARKYGEKWLANRIKVHVNVTNPSDYSFRSSQLIPYMPFAPDNLMRDHRKISFYDVTELDPGKGEALYSGMGIGEQYVGKTWDDRALLVRGPVLISLKDAARRVLLQQGFKDQEIPAPLQKQPLPSNYDDMVETLQERGWTTSAMDVHNETGFRPKLLNTAKAALFSLMPSGSLILVPDGYWNTPFWGGMLAGAALRGCQVLVITPRPENATFSNAFLLLSRSQELFSRLIMVQNELRDELKAVGGMLKTGVYAQDSDVHGLGAVEEFLEGIRNAPFLKEVFPFAPGVYTALEDVLKELKSQGFKPSYYAEDAEERKPKLHMKINVLVSESIQDLLAQPGWEDIFRAYFSYRAEFTAREHRESDVKETPEALRDAFDQTLESFWSTLSQEEQERSMAYLLIGSQNHNYRSMIMDAEVACVVSGADSLEALVDFFFLAGVSVWPDDLETLEKLLPEHKGWKRRLGRYIVKAL
jgi:hypothetical protein